MRLFELFEGKFSDWVEDQKFFRNNFPAGIEPQKPASPPSEPQFRVIVNGRPWKAKFATKAEAWAKVRKSKIPKHLPIRVEPV